MFFSWAKGHIFKTQTDTEVIIHLYEELGPQCVEKLRGMFAFAIWDENTKTLFLARDRVGIKPLYYWHERQILGLRIRDQGNPGGPCRRSERSRRR